MVDRCKNCGTPIAKFPLWSGEGEDKRFLWKNLFKMSIDSIILLVILVALITAYKIDTAKCEEMIENPLKFCERTNACKILAEEQFKQDTKIKPIINFPLEADI